MYKDAYKYTWLRMTEGRVVGALMGYVLLSKRMVGRLLDVKVWRGEDGGMSERLLVVARLKMVGGWRSAERMEGVRNVLKMSELNNRVKEKNIPEELAWKIRSVERWGGRECGEGVGKVQRYSNGVYQ